MVRRARSRIIRRDAHAGRSERETNARVRGLATIPQRNKSFSIISLTMMITGPKPGEMIASSCTKRIPAHGRARAVADFAYHRETACWRARVDVDDRTEVRAE